MPIQLSEKEKLLLMDQKTHEEICVDKYAKYANQAQDPQLKQLFNSYSGKEQVHLDTINQLLSGQMPNMGGQQNQGQQGQNQQGQQAQPQQMPNPQQMAGGNQAYNQVDAKLCTDMLMTEKYVSGAYDTAIFEFRDPNIRQILNHIQKEEQEHGEGIFQYMQGHGMYQVH